MGATVRSLRCISEQAKILSALPFPDDTSGRGGLVHGRDDMAICGGIIIVIPTKQAGDKHWEVADFSC
jgi:hypothetical protein